MNIITNNVPRDLVYKHEVPENILKNWFDYHDEYDGYDGYFKYKGTWYHLDQFTQTPPELSTWDGYLNDSYSTGVLIRLADNNEQVVCGYFT